MGVVEAIRAIYTVNLGVERSERVLVFTDKPSKREPVQPEDLVRRERLRDIALITSEAGRGLSKEIIFYEYIATGAHAKEPPKRLWELAFGKKTIDAIAKKGILSRILNKKADKEELKEAEEIILKHKKTAVDAVIALSNYSTSHTSFRNFLTGLCGARYASMPLFDSSMLEGAMDVDWKALEKRTRLMAKEVGMAVEIEVSAPNGTRLMMSKKGRRALADTGVITKKGAFGNLPAGEVFLAPVEGASNGKLVLEWAPTRRLSSPVTLTVRDGYVTDVFGTEPFAGQLREKLKERKENGNIAELGIGTNDRAKRADNILESEKILGTIHIALGDNSSFGGKVKTPFHQDFVFFRPTVALIGKDGKKTFLLEDGQPGEGF